MGDAAGDVADARERVRERTAEYELEAAILRSLPPDSTVRLADVHAARAQIYPEGYVGTDLPEWMVRSEAVRRLDTARTDADAADAITMFVRDSVGKVPTVLFLILPVFALLLKLLYVRRGWYYSEHLVFGLHTHAFAFVVFSVVALLLALAPSVTAVRVVANSLLFLAIPVYFLVAQKRVYGQGWVKTILKSLVLGWAYFFVLLAGLVGAFLLAAAVG